jgi:transcription antitermination protein NusB
VTDDRSGRRRALPRREARRRAVELLYEADLRRRESADLLTQVDALPDGPRLDEFSRALVSGVLEHRAEIDALIDRHARGWSVDRMAVVDRNILRLGTYELVHGEETPAAVVIDEAVELAKMLAGDESPGFVNGVLSAVHRSTQKEAD